MILHTVTRTRTGRAVLAVLAVLAAGAAECDPSGTTIHVFPTTGVSAVRKALSRARAGDRVLLHDDPDLAVDYPGQQYILDYRPEPGADSGATHVFIQAQPGVVVEKLVIVNSSYLVVEGIHVEPVGPHSGLRITDGSHDIVLDSVVVDATAALHGISIMAGDSGVRPRDVTIVDSDVFGSYGDMIAAYATDDLILLDSRIHDPTIRRDTTDHVDGIEMLGARGAHIRGNHFFDSEIPAYGGPHQAIVIGKWTTTDLEITGNTIGPWVGTGIIVSDRVDGVEGVLKRYEISDNTVRCANGGIIVNWHPPSDPPQLSGNTVVPRSDPSCPRPTG